MNYPKKIDLHIHTTVSDGTDTPEELLQKVKDAGIELFSVTDHDAVKASTIIPDLLKEGDPAFVCGAEFSCKDEEGKYHILGYDYDPSSESILKLVDMGHTYRINKVRARLDFLKDHFHFRFSDEDLKKLFAMDNPGKPHIANMMVRYGYTKTKEIAIKEYINLIHFDMEYVRPEEAIEGILSAGGIPVLAHPCYGSGDQLVIGQEMDERLQKLIGMGLQGVEAFYSGFTVKLQNEMLDFAKKYDLFVTAGSDYHGRNKMIELADNNLDTVSEYPEEMKRFLDELQGRQRC
jgi:predicted metal-dependent phosphoesterase TrpH